MSQAGGPYGKELRSKLPPPPHLPPCCMASQPAPASLFHLEIPAWLTRAKLLGSEELWGSEKSPGPGLLRWRGLPGQ